MYSRTLYSLMVGIVSTSWHHCEEEKKTMNPIQQYNLVKHELVMLQTLKNKMKQKYM